MKWEQRELGLALPGVISAVVTDVPQGWAARVFRPKEDQVCATEQDAKEWAEARMNEIKKEFILSLIVEEEGSYIFGKGVMKIAREDDGVWFLYGSDYDIITEGTLEECQDYIVSCF